MSETNFKVRVDIRGWKMPPPQRCRYTLDIFYYLRDTMDDRTLIYGTIISREMIVGVKARSLDL